MYEYGHGISRDYEAALKWYRFAAEQGYAESQFSLGWMYRKGKGVPQDDKTAVKWYRLAAEQGYAKSQFNLGVMYYTGSGVGQSDVYAYMWGTIAASNGSRYGDDVQNHVAKRLTKAQLGKAHKLADECIRKKYRGC
jgi:TPR repeat protein